MLRQLQERRVAFVRLGIARLRAPGAVCYHVHWYEIGCNEVGCTDPDEAICSLRYVQAAGEPAQVGACIPLFYEPANRLSEDVGPPDEHARLPVLRCGPSRFC